MLAEVDHLDVDLVACRPREQHLPAVPCGRDACAEVDVETDKALVPQLGRARVQSHPHPNGPAVERGLALGCRRDRLGRAREGVEERAALGVDLDAAVAGEGVPQYPPVLGKRLRVAVAELVQQPRRALDVGEEERDRATR